MKKIGLIGFGAIGEQVERLLIQTGFNEKEIFYFEDRNIDRDPSKRKRFWDFKIPEFKHFHFIPTIGYLSLKVKKEVIETIQSFNLSSFSFIHPSSFINPTAKIGNGVVIFPMCNVDQGVIIEDGVLINNSCVISHDSIIQESSYISPGVILSGFVEVGKCCFIGSGSVIANNVRIGENSIIGAGSCITKDIPDNSFAIGNPFQIKKGLKLT